MAKYNWKGGINRLPVCPVCGKRLSLMKSKYCRKHAMTGERNPFFGKSHSEETKAKISKKKKGYKPTKETIAKMKKSMLGKNTKEDPSYEAIHAWVRVRLGKPDTCEFCGANGLSGRKIHWANKSGEYKRNLSDWLRLCVPCHKKYDIERKEKYEQVS